jgi:hypothetical protein
MPAVETLDQFKWFQKRDPDNELSAGTSQYCIDRLHNPLQSRLAHVGAELIGIPAMLDEQSVYSAVQSCLSVTDKIAWVMILWRPQSA